MKIFFKKILKVFRFLFKDPLYEYFYERRIFFIEEIEHLIVDLNRVYNILCNVSDEEIENEKIEVFLVEFEEKIQLFQSSKKYISIYEKYMSKIYLVESKEDIEEYNISEKDLEEIDVLYKKVKIRFESYFSNQ